MKDYKGKKVFVGIDVHKKSYSVVSVCDGVVLKRDRIEGRPEALLVYLKKYFPKGKVHSAYEAGFSGFVLHRRLLSEGIKNIVVHAGSIEVSSRDRVKTDKRDALKIATQLAAGRLKGIHVPSEEREANRQVSRLREKLTGDRKRAGNRIKSLLHILGQKLEDDTKLSSSWLKKINRRKMDSESRYVFEAYVKQWTELSAQIKAVDKHLVEQAEADGALEVVYRSAPGVGVIHSRVLANELGDMLQFTSEKKLFSHTGLTPSEHSSGEHQRQGHISRQGNPLLRKVLVQAAWVAIKKDRALKKVYDRITKRAGAKRAIIGIARRLIGRIRACFRTGELYQYNYA